MITGMISGGFVIHGLVYLELEPTYYICANGLPCTSEEFCLEPDPHFGPSVVSYDYPLEHNTNIYNWYTKLGIVCKAKQKQGFILIASSAMIGTALSCLFLPRMGDLYGRKPIYVFALTLQIPCYFLCCFFS